MVMPVAADGSADRSYLLVSWPGSGKVAAPAVVLVTAAAASAGGSPVLR